MSSYVFFWLSLPGGVVERQARPAQLAPQRSPSESSQVAGVASDDHVCVLATHVAAINADNWRIDRRPKHIYFSGDVIPNEGCRLCRWRCHLIVGAASIAIHRRVATDSAGSALCHTSSLCCAPSPRVFVLLPLVHVVRVTTRHHPVRFFAAQ